jgi:hydrogenase/urease accessory protein HupE
VKLILTVLVTLLAMAGAALAHDARPAYLELRQLSGERYDVTWRTPMLSGVRLPVVLKLPESVRDVSAPSRQELADSIVERRVIEATGGLAGRRIEFTGLPGTIADVLVRVQSADGNVTTMLARPSQPWVETPASPGSGIEVAVAFAGHGVEHILLGYDHLLFVLALMLIVRSPRALVWTVTAFTFAHSLTLALAALGLVQVPAPPVEAAIAFSIVLLASEIVRLRRGGSSLTARWPWIVAFSFGLLHGFGFAGALTDIGLPRSDIPLALFAFNVGVELGQLAFIGVVLGIFALVRGVRLTRPMGARAMRLAPYAIGSLGAFWFIERVAAFAVRASP